MTPSLTISDVYRRFGDVAAVDGVSLSVWPGEFVALLGPSGCGKTSLLRLVAGFLQPDSGRILSRGSEITHLPPYRRKFGVVFQNYALFPHMTVLENVGYGLKVRGRARREITAAARGALDRVGLQETEDRFPNQLSGGQQQRVALARAIVIEPELLLLDEPLSALDKGLREEMQVELRLLQRRIGIATLFVTHDQEEAMTLSDRIAVMRDGRLMQVGVPRDVYALPENEFVATFLGTTNLLTGQVASTSGDLARVQVGASTLLVEANGLTAGCSVKVAVRPEDLRLSASGPGLAGTVRDVLFQGHRLIVFFETAGGIELRAFVPPGMAVPEKGTAAFADWPPHRVRIFPL